MRPRLPNRCPAGRPFGATRTRYTLEQQGDCEGCGAGPLHGVLRCPCSFLRNGRRLCRDCAIGYDLVTIGSTRIKSEETDVLDREFVMRLRDLLRRGERVA